MVNNKNQYNYYRYLGSSITDACCTNNGLHRDMYGLGTSKGHMVSFLKPMDTFRSICISDIITEEGTLDKAIADYSAKELRNMGLALPVNFSSSHRSELNTSYILNSSLCWVSIKTKKGTNTFFATKSPFVLSGLYPNFAETEIRKRRISFNEQFITSYKELNTGIFQVVTLINDNGGLRIGKDKINCNAKNTIITTMYAIGNFIDSVSNYLGKNKALIVYIENGEERNVVTTLVPTVVEKWIGGNDKSQAENIIKNSQNPFVYGELILPNLYTKKEFVNVPVLSIKSIREFK